MSLNLASYIDHTLLKESVKINEVDRLCMEASSENFAAVCVRPKFVAAAKSMLNGSGVKVATVIAFPLGDGTKEIKAQAILEALSLGADEVDMVIDICALKCGKWKTLEDEIRTCVMPVAAAGKVIKLIVESGILTDPELLGCCRLYRNYQVDFMKTSTGYAEIGATLHAVELMRANLPAEMGIKASGGIRTLKFAKELIDAGATRLGCSPGMEIMKEERAQMMVDNFIG